MNPVDEFLQEKRGGARSGAFSNAKHFPGMFGDALLTGAAGAASAGVIAGAGIAAAQIYNAATKGRDFRNMLVHNPDLVEEHAKDPKAFNQLFSSLRSVNTSFSRDPVIAGTYMRRMVGSPAAGGVLTDAIGFQGDKQTPHFGGSVMQGGLGSAKVKIPKDEKAEKPAKRFK
jgi:hypothetical protein